MKIIRVAIGLGCMSEPNRDAPTNDSFCDKPPANNGADNKGNEDA